jgi:hypothetical protein
MERESDGKNIFGHDAGGAYSDPNKNIEVTEARYKDFLKLIGAGQTSNGVGPMQLTYRGYHIGPASLQARGLKGWLPADTIPYGVEILAKSLKTQLAKGLPMEKAFWNVAKLYNAGKLEGPAGVNYADGALASSRAWLAAVGDDDMKPEDDDMATAKEIADELLKPENLKKIAVAVWTAEILPPGKDNKDPNDKTWQPKTFLVTTYNRVYDLLKKP